MGKLEKCQLTYQTKRLSAQRRGKQKKGVPRSVATDTWFPPLKVINRTLGSGDSGTTSDFRCVTNYGSTFILYLCRPSLRASSESSLMGSFRQPPRELVFSLSLKELPIGRHHGLKKGLVLAESREHTISVSRFELRP